VAVGGGALAVFFNLGVGSVVLDENLTLVGNSINVGLQVVREDVFAAEVAVFPDVLVDRLAVFHDNEVFL